MTDSNAVSQSRRALLAGGLASLISACAGQSINRATNHSAKARRLVIVGGGFAGASCAKTAKELDPSLDVVLIEANKTYTACPFSNLVIVGHRTLVQQQFDYAALRRSGVQLVHSYATNLDTQKQLVILDDGSEIPYTKLVVAPGVDMRFDSLDGYDAAAANKMPHAWKAGAQTMLLKQQLQAMPENGLVVISAPANPYRCPPGPYERASLITHFLQQSKPRAKLLILDGKDRFSKQSLFQNAWRELYGERLEWRGLSDGATVVGVDSATNTVMTDFDTIKADVVNIIPPQYAGYIARRAGLTDASGWCPIRASDFSSTLAEHVYVIGDAAIANAMPKSAFSANTQAKLCALQIVRALQGQPPISSKLINTCYSLVRPDYGISVADVYFPEGMRWQEVAGAGGVSRTPATPEERAREAGYAQSWFETITREVFA